MGRSVVHANRITRVVRLQPPPQIAAQVTCARVENACLVLVEGIVLQIRIVLGGGNAKIGIAINNMVSVIKVHVVYFAAITVLEI